MTAAYFAWELFKLTLGICLIMAAAIYTIASFAASVMKIEAAPCGAETDLDYPGYVIVAVCSRGKGHDGLHHDEAFDVDWSDAPAREEVSA